MHTHSFLCQTPVILQSQLICHFCDAFRNSYSSCPPKPIAHDSIICCSAIYLFTCFPPHSLFTCFFFETIVWRYLSLSISLSLPWLFVSILFFLPSLASLSESTLLVCSFSLTLFSPYLLLFLGWAHHLLRSILLLLPLLPLIPILNLHSWQLQWENRSRLLVLEEKELNWYSEKHLLQNLEQNEVDWAVCPMLPQIETLRKMQEGNHSRM